MGNIPTVPGSETDISTPVAAAKLNPGIARMRFAGSQAIGAALQDVGAEAQSLDNDLLKVKQAGIAADASMRMRAAKQSFADSIQGDEKEEDWQSKAQDLAGKVREDVFAAHDVPVGMRDMLNRQLDLWGQDLQLEAHHLAQQQTIHRTTGLLQKAYDEAGRDGDAPGMLAQVSLGRASKLNPVLMDQWERNIPQSVALTAIENGFRNNPKGTYDLLKSGAALPVKDAQGNDIVPSKVFSPKQLEALQNTGRVQTARWQTENLRNMFDDADPVTGFIPDETIRQQMKNGTIDPRAGTRLIDTQTRKAEYEKRLEYRMDHQEAKNAYDVLMTRIHDPFAWQTQPEVYAHELIGEAAGISDPILRAQAVNDSNRQLASVQKNRQVAQGPVEREMLKRLNEDREYRNVTIPLEQDTTEGTPASGHLWWKKPGTPARVSFVPYEGGMSSLRKLSDDEVEQKFGTKTKKDTLLQAEELHYAQLQGQLRDWFKTPEGQGATMEQAEKFRQSIERPYVMEAAEKALGVVKPEAAMKGSARSYSEPDRAALDWAKANPKDARAKKIYERLGLTESGE